MLFIEYPKCSTCQKAKKWLDENGFEYESRHIKEENDIIFTNRCNGVCITMLSKLGWSCMCMHVFT